MRACGVLWPVCPSCLGEGLYGLPARRWRCARCGGEWSDAERVPCPDLAMVALFQVGGGPRGWLCASHAMAAAKGSFRSAVHLPPLRRRFPATCRLPFARAPAPRSRMAHSPASVRATSSTSGSQPRACEKLL